MNDSVRPSQFITSGYSYNCDTAAQTRASSQ
jgi:hypothetical protein